MKLGIRNISYSAKKDRYSFFKEYKSTRYGKYFKTLEEALACKNEWYEVHKDDINKVPEKKKKNNKVWQKKYYQKNRERILKNTKEYQNQNRQAVRNYNMWYYFNRGPSRWAAKQRCAAGRNKLTASRVHKQITLLLN